AHMVRAARAEAEGDSPEQQRGGSGESPSASASSGIQRIGLSATQRPLERIGDFLVGPKRQCKIVDAGTRKALDIEIVVPVDDMADPGAPAYPNEDGTAEPTEIE